MRSVAVLGLGKMGAAMSRRLRAEGHQVVIWNRNKDARDKLVSEQICGPPFVYGTTLQETLQLLKSDGLVLAVLTDCEAVLTMLQDSSLKQELSGRVFANLASANPDEGRAVAKVIRQQTGAKGYLDCAYCGPPSKVQSGLGQLFVSSDDGGIVFETWKHLLDKLGSTVFCGKVGSSRALDYGVVDLAFVSYLSFVSNSAMLEGEGVDIQLYIQEATKRLNTVPLFLNSCHQRMQSRSDDNYSRAPTATLGNWRTFWSSRLPYLAEHKMPSELPDFVVSLLDNALGKDKQYINDDVTRLQELLRYGKKPLE